MAAPHQPTINTPPQGRTIAVVGDVYRFSSEDGRRLIRRAAGELGLIEGYSTEQKIGLVVALIGGAGAAAALVTLAIVALLR